MAGNAADFKRLPLWHAGCRERYSYRHVTSLPDFGCDFAPYGERTGPIGH